MPETLVVNMKLYKKHMWLMIDVSTHRVLQEFFDCENVRKRFPDLVDRGDNYYRIPIIKLHDYKPKRIRRSER